MEDSDGARVWFLLMVGKFTTHRFGFITHCFGFVSAGHIQVG